MAKPWRRFIGGLLRVRLRHELHTSRGFPGISLPDITEAFSPSFFHTVSPILFRSHARSDFSAARILISESQSKVPSGPFLLDSALGSPCVLLCSKGSKLNIHRKSSSPPPPPLPPPSTKYSSRSKNPFSHRRRLSDVSESISNLARSRHFSVGASDRGKIKEHISQGIIDWSVSSVQSAILRYQEAFGLQIDAFWQRNYLLLLSIGGFLACGLLWRVLFGVADALIGFSEGMAKYRFLVLSAAIVSFTGLYVRSRLAINPDRVYRMAMRRLNMSAGILEVMGAPLSGTDLRACLMSGGGLTLKSFKPGLRRKRCFLIFPVRGSERKGIVSVEVKKKKGKYDMKLLAVDIPMGTGEDQRLFVVGDEGEYRVGNGLISELRDPVVKAMTASKLFEDRDRLEDERDAERQLQEAENNYKEETNALEKSQLP